MNTPTTFCSHRPPCPGCPRFGESGVPTSLFERLENLAREADAPAPAVVCGAPLGYRHRARLSVRGRSTSPKVGIFEEGSHAIVDIPNCLVHHPLINHVAGRVKRVAKQLRVAPYSDIAHRGELRGIQVVVERASQTAQLVLIGNATTPEALMPLAKSLEGELGDTLHSVWWNGQPERSNAVLGPHWKSLYGPASVREEFRGVGVHFPPGAFGQANLDLADDIIAQIADWVPAGSHVAEFYAGSGAIGLSLIDRCASLAINERNPHSLSGLALGLAERSDEEQARVRVFEGAAGERLDALANAQVVIADPPRKGLDPELLEALIDTPPDRFVYLSCDVTSFERDARALLASQRHRLSIACAYALFPQTEHIETLALFRAASAH